MVFDNFVVYILYRFNRDLQQKRQIKFPVTDVRLLLRMAMCIGDRRRQPMNTFINN